MRETALFGRPAGWRPRCLSAFRIEDRALQRDGSHVVVRQFEHSDQAAAADDFAQLLARTPETFAPHGRRKLVMLRL